MIPYVPAVTVQQMMEIDRLMMQVYGIQLQQMMENAGRALAELCRLKLAGSVANKKICVAVGPGNNGGGGLVAARHLSNWGAEVIVLFTFDNQTKLKKIPAAQLEILQNLPVSLVSPQKYLKFVDWCAFDYILDAILGYGINREAQGVTAEIINLINQCNLPVISLDIPSGIEASGGKVYEPAVRASETLTLALPKRGMYAPQARRLCGDIYLADISVPPLLYNQLGIKVPPLFAQQMIVPLNA